MIDKAVLVSGIQQSDSAVHIYVSILFRILFPFAAAAAKLLQSYPTLCDPICYAMLSHFSHVRLFVTPQTAAHQAPPSLGFSRQEHWSGLPFPSPMHEREK